MPKKAIAGIVCVYFAGLGWITDIIIPFTHLSHKPALFAAALGFAELSFLVGVGLLGKTYYQQLKSKLIDTLRRGRS